MPRRRQSLFKTPCAMRGCPNACRTRYCDEHRHEYSDNQKQSPTRRGYGARWQRLRLVILRRDPICEAPGCTNPSTDVDHIVPRSQGGDDTMDNLQGLCHGCHSRKTLAEGAFGRKPKKATPGPQRGETPLV